MEVEARLTRLEERTEHIQRDVAEIKAEIKTEVRADLRRLDAKIDAVRDAAGSLAERIASVEVKLSAMEASIIKWIVATAIALTALAFGIGKFVS